MQVPVYPLVVVLDAKAVEQFVGDQSHRSRVFSQLWKFMWKIVSALLWVLGVQTRPADNQPAAG